MQPEQGGPSYHREHWWSGGLSSQSRVGQGLQGALAWCVEEEGVRTAVCEGIAGHFREHCWADVEGTGPEVGSLGRVEKPLAMLQTTRAPVVLR